MIGGTIQVVIAIALVIVLLVVGYSVYNLEAVQAMKTSNTTRKSVSVFEGIKDLQTTQEYVVTKDPSHPLFKDIMPSYNQLGGAEYTYNFWMYMDTSNGALGTGVPDQAVTDMGLAQGDVILFLRGDKQAIKYKSICSKRSEPVVKYDVLVKSPMVKLQQGGDVLALEFNTVEGPDAIKENTNMDVCGTGSSNEWDKRNQQRIGVKGLKARTEFSKRWFMVTIVLQDTFPTDPYPVRNRVRARIYINGFLEVDTYADGKLASTRASMLRNNNGNLYISPKIPVPAVGTDAATTTNTFGANALKMADLTYFNYAISNEEIKALVDAGYTVKAAQNISMSSVTADSTEERSGYADTKQLATL